MYKFIYIKLVLSLAILFVLNSIARAQEFVCSGQTKTYTVDGNENGGTGTTESSYLWEILTIGSNAIITEITSSGNRVEINWNDTPAGTYTLQVTETNESNCASTQNIEIEVHKIISDLEPTYQFCGFGSVEIGSLFNPNYTYSWQTPEGYPLESPGNSNEFTTNFPGVYMLTITDILTGCTRTFSTDVQLIDSPIVIEEIQIVDETTIEIIAMSNNNNIANFEYSLNGIVWQSSNRFNDLTSGETYTAFVRNQNGCITRKEFIMLFIPNTITPNGDGINDTFRILGATNFGNVKMQIFDRYGKLIYNSSNASDLSWSGTYLGNPLPTATYWYIIELGEGNGKKIFRGHVTIKNVQ